MTRTLPPRPPTRLTPLGQTTPRVLDRIPASQTRTKQATFNSAV
jgi:hypothetical protein